MTYKSAAFFWLLRGARRREFRYIYKPENPSRTGGREYLFHIFLTTTRDFNEIERSILLIMVICEIQLFWFVLILGIKIHQGWDRSFKLLKFHINIHMCKKCCSLQCSNHLKYVVFIYCFHTCLLCLHRMRFLRGLLERPLQPASDMWGLRGRTVPGPFVPVHTR